MTNSIYRANGYKSRKEYLGCLAEEFGIPYSTVETYADMLGPSEDFDALVSTLVDEFGGNAK